MAWQPAKFDQKVVVRAGTGMYYDRGELYTYLSPGFAAGIVSGGPFGISQTPPFVTAQTCPYSASPYGNTSDLYDFFIPICGVAPFSGSDDSGAYTLATPWGPAPNPAPTDPSAASLVNFLPNASGIIAGIQPYTLGNYNSKNKLPYSINFTLDIQYQPTPTMMIELGYVGNLGRHQVIPLPFNQAHIATTASPTLSGGPHPQHYSYGYSILDPNNFEPICVNDPGRDNSACGGDGQMQVNYEGGNVDLRVPYTGYSSESESYTAAGISAYHALQAHLEKRLSHGVQAGVSYTFSHTTDEQSALGLFYNGNDPTNLRSGYGSADFDRKHVLNFTYSYTLPKFFGDNTLAGKLANSWAIHGLGIIQSGQPYAVIDFSGAVGSIYYSTFDGITNPIVPLAKGCSAKDALTGRSGAFYDGTAATAALKASCFTVPLISPGDLGVPAGDTYETNFTNGQRNIFRQSFQKRTDASLVKSITLHDKYSLRYTFDVYNVTNTTSFDIPSDDVTQNTSFNNEPVLGQSLYSTPGGLGVTKHTIGSPRQVQMSLHFDF
jgi:hypothetical protein